MAWNTNLLLILLIVLLIRCANPHPKFESNGKQIFICNSGNYNSTITTTECSEQSFNHVKSTDRSFTGGMSLFINLCDTSYKIDAFGDFEIIGKPEFEFFEKQWINYNDYKDSVLSVYEFSNCRFRYSE